MPAWQAVALLSVLPACAEVTSHEVDAAWPHDAAPPDGAPALDATAWVDATFEGDASDARPWTEERDARTDPSIVTLWNGVDLSEWTGEETVWRVVDGAIVARTETGAVAENTFLIYQRGEFADFVLRAELWLEPGGNSGIQYRSVRVAGSSFAMAGYQADAAEANFGLLYEERGRGSLAATSGACAGLRTGTWLHYEIEARGDRLVQRIDEHECVRYREEDGAQPRSGLIALQYHAPGGFEVRFRRLTLRVLNDSLP